jgi:hypothetical protein
MYQISKNKNVSETKRGISGVALKRLIALRLLQLGSLNRFSKVGVLKMVLVNTM